MKSTSRLYYHKYSLTVTHILIFEFILHKHAENVNGLWWFCSKWPCKWRYVIYLFFINRLGLKMSSYKVTGLSFVCICECMCVCLIPFSGHLGSALSQWREVPLMAHPWLERGRAGSRGTLEPAIGLWPRGWCWHTLHPLEPSPRQPYDGRHLTWQADWWFW